MTATVQWTVVARLVAQPHGFEGLLAVRKIRRRAILPFARVVDVGGAQIDGKNQRRWPELYRLGDKQGARTVCVRGALATNRSRPACGTQASTFTRVQ
jgi:hypothetical protein